MTPAGSVAVLGSLLGAVAAVLTVPGQAAAEPGTYAIGKCLQPGDVPQVKPTRFAYNCDETGVMEDLTWTSWGPDGARGTGTDSSVECQPNCAEGTRLINPIVVHAWNPQPPPAPGCPPGMQFYSDLTIAYPDGVPPWIEPGTTWDTGTDFVTVDGLPAVHFSGLSPTCS